MRTLIIASITFLAGALLGAGLVAAWLGGGDARGPSQATPTPIVLVSAAPTPLRVPVPTVASTQVAASGRPEMVMFSGFESNESRPFDLAGDYSVEWTNSLAGATYGSPFTVRLMPASGNGAPDLVVNTAHDAGATYSGQTLLRNRQGKFYVDVLSGGQWSLTLRPIPPTTP